MKFRSFLAKSLLFLDDFLLLCGEIVIIVTNFRANDWLGWYTLGAVLIVDAVLIARGARPQKGGNK